MAYILNSVNLRRPQAVNLERGSQTVQVRTLNGNIHRDIFGDEKRTWVLRYSTILPADYTIIETQYNNYLTIQQAITWQVTEGSYPVAETRVHVDLPRRAFKIPGSTYLSDFDLILTEV